MAKSNMHDDKDWDEIASNDSDSSLKGMSSDTSYLEHTDQQLSPGRIDESLQASTADQDFDASTTTFSMADNTVLAAYRNLSSRRVDLVGDYAGNELFLIDGDSLLLHCFSDRTTDLQNGLQLLHAVFAVENFLSHLKRRKCCFKIVFLEASRDLCIPPNTSEGTGSRYLLAREAVIRHLQAHISTSEVDILVFQDHHDSNFLSFLQEESPYFLMLHDRAYEESTAASKEDKARQVLQRRLLLDFIQQGYNVALVNELVWRDSKVMTVVLESKQRSEKAEAHTALVRDSANIVDEPVHNLQSQLEKLELRSSALTERQSLLVLTVGQMLTTPQDLSSSTLQDLSAKLILHQALLTYLPISNRRIASCSPDSTLKKYINQVASLASRILAGQAVRRDEAIDNSCDVADFLDGRLFHMVCQGYADVSDIAKLEFEKISQEVSRTFEGVEILKLPTVRSRHDGRPNQCEQQNLGTEFKVLPFSNYVFDTHLSPISLQIENNEAQKPSIAAQRIFKEISHWHNQHRLMDSKAVRVVKDARQAARFARREQLFMAEMRTYAASLTNAVGKSLEPEAILVGNDDSGSSEARSSKETKSSGAHKESKTDSDKPKPKGGAKAAKLNATKQNLLAKTAAEKVKKDAVANEKIFLAWQSSCKDFDHIQEPTVRYRTAQTHFLKLQSSWQTVIGPQSDVYLLGCLVQTWSLICKSNDQHNNMHIAALIWHHVRRIYHAQSMPSAMIKKVQRVVTVLGLPELPMTTKPLGDSKTDVEVDFKLKAVESVRIAAVDFFQLIHCGPFIERSFNAKEDTRVQFKPDEWQSRVLDCIDEDKSVFVVAPTSAGKTFISFYAMRKILKADDDGVLVYVAPTKALVNQIAAEIQARYTKNFKYGGKSVWAIHTRDYRVNNPTGCQILVTVPHILQIMLLSPSNARSWSTRVRRIIFDEVHSIGNTDDGVVWEQLLLMAPCPIIALSATVGNPQEFGQWLGSTQEAMNNELVTVEHPHRYSDLRKYFYESPKQFVFTGIPDKLPLVDLGLDGLPGFEPIHPVITIDKARGIPEDLALESRDCYHLWKAMQKVETKDYAVWPQLNPQLALPSIVRKVDVLVWEKDLKALLQVWLQDTNSPFDRLIEELAKGYRGRIREPVYNTHADREITSIFDHSNHNAADSTLALLCRLQERDALPAILFNYDRSQCEEICQKLCDQLKAAEFTQVKSGMKWTKKLERYEEYKQRQEEASARMAKAQSRKPKKGNGKERDDERVSRLDLEKENGGGPQDSEWASFDPDAAMSGYHFADYIKAQTSEIVEYAQELEYRGVQPWLIAALHRGIGVHHAGMNRKYRQVVEILFRKRFLRVVVATGTLALGINMPCKTTVFVNDSVYLTALNYRQCAGRAGRRGFDLLGNVVFHGISEQKVSRLISSRLPDLNGHFPLTTSLVLRLFLLLHESKGSLYATSVVNALLSQPRLYLGGDSFKEQTLHHLRFSIEYLRRQDLLGIDGAPLNFAGLVTHLYYTENSSFAFHALLKEGYFHQLCADIHDKESRTLEALMHVMAHIFGRIFCRRVDLEYKQNVVKPSSSIVFLPPLPEEAAQILKNHNKQTLQVYKTYVKTFVDQHIAFDDNKLPLTGVSFGTAHNQDSAEPYDTPTSIRSSFIALSGSGDDFESIHDLCSTVRSGVYLEEAVIPYMQVSSDGNEPPLNAWLLDFYKHGDVKTLERANGIRRSDVWFHLNDFSLVLATIVTSLSNFMKLTETDDADILDVQGGLDELENAKEATILASMDAEAAKTTSTAVIHEATGAAKTRKEKVAESWDDEVDNIATVETGTYSSVPNGMHDSISGIGTRLKGDNGGLLDVLKAFQKLQIEFNEKFKAMWA